MPKRIILCFDGTWNKPADDNIPAQHQVETNVRRFYEALTPHSPDGTVQLPWYDTGVGTHWYDKVIGGLTGVGLDLNIMEGYKYLAKNYEDGDEVFVLGFSRGAYTARSLVGLIRNCGLICRVKIGANSLTAAAFVIYRAKDDGPDSNNAVAFRNKFARPINIKFVGVWDTVGALGIPISFLKDLNDQVYQFHDTKLSRIVENAYHALAVDEHRKPYEACLWNPPTAPQQNIEQRWFIGAHSDVGGGYPDRRLSDLTLHWMMEKARSHGLGFDPVKTPGNLDQNYRHGQFTDSYARFLKGEYAKLAPRHFRPVAQTAFGNEVVDESVKKRKQEDAAYTPQNLGLS